MMNATLSRRRFLETIALGSGVALATQRPARAGGAGNAAGSTSVTPPKLGLTDPSAIALGYVEDAAKVNVAKFPSYVHGSNCANCLQLGGAEGEPYRPCASFNGKLVAIAGWCSAWTAEM